MITVRDAQFDDHDGIVAALHDGGFYDVAVMRRPGERYNDVLVAVDPDDGTVVGVIEGDYHGEYADRIAEHIPTPQTWGSLLAVAHAHRRRGVARALLAEFARRGRAAGSTYFVAKVDESNETGGRMSFFASCGLRPVMPEQEDDVVAGRLDAVIEACG